MRDIVLFCLIFGALPFVLKKPFVGVLLFTWVSLMNPHRFAYGAAYDFPFDSVIVVVTLIGLLISKEKKVFPINAVTVTLLTLTVWMTITSVFAMEPERAWQEWARVTKTMFLFCVVVLTVNTKKEIRAFAWTIGLSIGFFGFKGGVFTVLSGGASHVIGPEGSYIFDNNALALGTIMAMPIMGYMLLDSDRLIMRLSMVALLILSTFSVVGSYSRGALLTGVAMVLFLLSKNNKKLITALLLLAMIPVALIVMPEQWFHRMQSIQEYASDSSSLGRFNAWQFALNIADSSITGGGFECFTRRLFVYYAPNPQNFHAAHSIYFQVIGEHGYIGFGLFVLLLLLTWLTGNRILKLCKTSKELDWAKNLAVMCQVSMTGFMVGGAFLSMAYYDQFYDIVALLIVLQKAIQAVPEKKTIYA